MEESGLCGSEELDEVIIIPGSISLGIMLSHEGFIYFEVSRLRLSCGELATVTSFL
jgi:hypothetical protein